MNSKTKKCIIKNFALIFSIFSVLTTTVPHTFAGNAFSRIGAHVGQEHDENVYNTDFLEAIQRGDKRTVANLLLHNNFNFNIPFRDGHYPLEVAIENNQHKIFRTLLNSGRANPNLDRNIRPYLFYGNLNKKDIKALLRNGADIEFFGHPNIMPMTPLADAVVFGFYLNDEKETLDKITILLKHGANVNARIGERRDLTALHLCPNLYAAVLLLKHGADPNIRDNDGRTPADMAPSEDVQRLLINYNNFECRKCLKSYLQGQEQCPLCGHTFVTERSTE